MSRMEEKYLNCDGIREAFPNFHSADETQEPSPVSRTVRVAASAGFCFGVKRAVQTCYEQAKSGQMPVYTFGPIIHNELVVEDLEEKGVHPLMSEEELTTVQTGTVIIRSHGVPRRICDRIKAQGLTLVDATCPFVKRIHRIVEEKTASGWDVVIVGKAAHPEVQGICGWAEETGGMVTVIETPEEAELFVEKRRKEPLERRKLCIVSQTTFQPEKFNNLVEILKKLRYSSLDVLNTICNATQERQSEARSLAAASDVMLVIGGRNSSNTQKLYEICKKECPSTFFIQKLVDLDNANLPSSGCLGITAGASTPNILIEEVSKRCQK